MNKKALRILEYPKIIARLEELADSAPGKALCQNLLPSTKLEEIRTMQQETTAAASRIVKHGTVSFARVTDITPCLKRLEVGATLGPHDLLRISRLLGNASSVKLYGKHENEKEEEDCLDPYFLAIQPVGPLAAEINRCIPSEEEISDAASPGLNRVRRQMQMTNEKIRSALLSMVNGSVRTYLQEQVVTQRNGRYCLPVKSEHRSQVPGMIHDQSATGSTVFIEPMAVVKLNNEIRELEIQEDKEIEAVLASLSEQAAGYLTEIKENMDLLTRLDFIFARGKLSVAMKASEPDFNTNGYVRIKKGRHPLLNPDTVVPIDIEIGKKFTLLVITGPNTGGKTVSLKTVGLFTLMGQAGLHIPAFDHSELAVFNNVFADIGDEQSIEQNLSTFSSHMTHIVNILKMAKPNSLVLFDELCAGTDPTEGAALAISILSSLHQKKIRTISTTHYSELKVYALTTPGVENGCCEFNVETLSPTYRLLIGIPGKSNAFAISSKLGLPSAIIEDARNHLSDQQESFEDLLTDLEQSRVRIEKEQEEITRSREAADSLKKKLEQKQEKLDDSREQILKKAHDEAAEILREAKEYADTTIRNFQKFGKANISASEMEKERTKLREKMNQHQKKSDKILEQKKKAVAKPKELHIGDSVKVLSMNLNGTVTTLPNAKNQVYVQMGILRSLVDVSDLALIDEPVITTTALKKTGSGKILMNKSANVGIEINLLGKTVDEALAELDKYLDDAYIAHLPSVRIVHGKGTGALRKGVHNYLRRQKHIKEFHLAEFGEGDAGVTIATFK